MPFFFNNIYFYYYYYYFKCRGMRTLGKSERWWVKLGFVFCLQLSVLYYAPFLRFIILQNLRFIKAKIKF